MSPSSHSNVKCSPLRLHCFPLRNRELRSQSWKWRPMGCPPPAQAMSCLCHCHIQGSGQIKDIHFHGWLLLPDNLNGERNALSWMRGRSWSRRKLKQGAKGTAWKNICHNARWCSLKPEGKITHESRRKSSKRSFHFTGVSGRKKQKVWSEHGWGIQRGRQPFPAPTQGAPLKRHFLETAERDMIFSKKHQAWAPRSVSTRRCQKTKMEISVCKSRMQIWNENASVCHLHGDSKGGFQEQRDGKRGSWWDPNLSTLHKCAIGLFKRGK